MRCPKCHSEQIEQPHWGRRAGTLLGGGLGLWGAFSAGVCAGGEGGALVGLVGGPAGSVAGSCAGAVIGGLAAVTAAALAGSKLGDVFDAQVLDDNKCLECGYRFQSAPD